MTLSLNPLAIHLLDTDIDKINWMFLSKNSGAIEMLEANQEKINWSMFCQNQLKPSYKYWLENIVSNNEYVMK